MTFRSRWIVAVLVVAAAAIAAPVASPATGGNGAPPFAAKLVKTPKLDSSLGEVARTERQGGSGVAKAKALGLDVEGQSVRVVLEASGSRARAEAAVGAAGGEIEATNANLVQALVRPAALEGLSKAAGVAYVRPPLRPVPQVITGQEVAGSAADVFQAALWDGAGVKVAIIDLGFGGLAARQAEGEIPAGVVTQDFCGGQFGVEVHGTGVTEIVHEVAPGAQLYLLCIDSEVTLGQAETYAKANGITIVNHSVGWFNAGRGDGSGGAGTVNGIVADARANGILWINSAGNYQQRHWSGNWNAGGGYSDVQDFAPGDETQDVTIVGGQQGCFFLKWDAWPTTNQDFDMYLLNGPNLATAGVVALSTNDQSGAPGGLPPTEEFCYTNPGPTATFYLIIVNYDASTSPRFDLFVLGSTSSPQYKVTTGSLVEPASSPSAMAVGALCWSDGLLRSYSSLGPTVDGRVKPDIAGLDGVSGATYGIPSGCSGGFTGTSAASPHVVGLAALGKQQNPSLTPAQLQKWLEARAQDVYSPGKDIYTGAGRAWVYTFTDTPPWTPLQSWVELLFRKGTTTGCLALNPSTGSRLYCPNDPVTRRDMAVFIDRSLNQTPFDNPTPTFADVFPSDWFYGWVERFYQLNITTGCAINPLRYCPSDFVTRRDMAVFIIRALNETPFDNPTPTFADVPADMFGYGHVERFYQLGITTGCAVNPLRYCPLDLVDRKAMAAFLVRAFGPPT